MSVRVTIKMRNCEAVRDMWRAGSRPGKGGYCCTNCGWFVALPEESSPLPPCGKCSRGAQTDYQRCQTAYMTAREST